MSTVRNRAEQFEQQNVEAAQIVLSDIEAYGGQGSGIVLWARLTMLHHRERTGPDAKGLPFMNRSDAWREVAA